MLDIAFLGLDLLDKPTIVYECEKKGHIKVSRKDDAQKHIMACGCEECGYYYAYTLESHIETPKNKKMPGRKRK